MVFRGILLISTVVFLSCHRQKEVVVTAPDNISIVRPNTFIAEAEVVGISTGDYENPARKYYNADLLIQSINGRGSSLIENVSVGDTIKCVWSYREGDWSLSDNIAKKKVLEATIEERPAFPSDNYAHFIIQSYHFR